MLCYVYVTVGAASVKVVKNDQSVIIVSYNNDYIVVVYSYGDIK